jgi:hypothetical protein
MERVREGVSCEARAEISMVMFKVGNADYLRR